VGTRTGSSGSGLFVVTQQMGANSAKKEESESKKVLKMMGAL
jgi:hypothetical protein